LSLEEEDDDDERGEGVFRSPVSWTRSLARAPLLEVGTVLDDPRIPLKKKTPIDDGGKQSAR
jgi:hypothetical protein